VNKKASLKESVGHEMWVLGELSKAVIQSDLYRFKGLTKESAKEVRRG